MVDEPRIRTATAADAVTVAALLDAFNREFDTPTPGVEVLTARLRRTLTGGDLIALLGGEPASGVAVVSLRPSVWADGPTALLEELYVQPDLRRRRLGHALLAAACDTARARGAAEMQINVDGVDTDARRFYETHGFRHIEPDRTEPMYFYYRDLGD
ncbi:GNAT family N-acetyltransferase [Nocardia sp. alder85J]|uniref:GNAT family N-acetyltransferase n=1 Tax=Nocardia sp. alder85J TaxID=2862949 RepID=UPI001CD1E017|nr:GNAT family N-acetyltransferase [Nocardia sp. alder85J]MCX4091823.1 GNAT family N-acetyltransferase [Nocardia sp. alder85J]